MRPPLTGILPTATGSEVNRLSREDGQEINNGNMAELLSERGVEYIRRVISNNIKAGCSFGVTSTFRLTPFRPKETRNWQIPRTKLTLPEQYENWSQLLIDIAKTEYGERPILGNVCPITNTSPSLDDSEYAKVGSGSREARIELSRIIHDAQVRVLADCGVDIILEEACRHPDDALGLARSARENGIRNLLVSFEAESDGVPDPILQRPGIGFADVQSEIQAEAGDDCTVQVGANCVGTTLLRKLLERNERLDIVYPNQLDTGRSPADLAMNLRTVVSETPDAKLRDEVRKMLDAALETPMDELSLLWKECKNSGVKIGGICCGGRPEHVAAARNVWDSSHL